MWAGGPMPARIGAGATTFFGTVLARQGRFEEALAAYLRAIQIFPGYAEAHINQGWRWRSCAGWRKRLALSTRAAAPADFVEAWTQMGNALWARGQSDEAVAAYRRAIQLRPGLPEAHNYLGFVLKERGAVEEAVQ